MDLVNPAGSGALGWHAPLARVLLIFALAIVLGALGAARWAYRKYRVRSAWAGIKVEREENKRRFAQAAETFGRAARVFHINLETLESLRMRIDEPDESRSGNLDWSYDLPLFADTAWQAVQRQRVTKLMQPSQVQEVAELYDDLSRLRMGATTLTQALESARKYDNAQPQHRGQLTGEIALAQAVLKAHGEFGVLLRQFSLLHTDFAAVPSIPPPDGSVAR